MNNPSFAAFLNIQRTFSAPRDLVYHAWTDAEAMAGWFKPQGQITKIVRLDARVGGGYHFELYNDSGIVTSIRGEYIEVVPPEKLVFTWVTPMTDEVETLITLRFIERGRLTEMLLTHERFPGEQIMSAHLAGWNWMLDHLTTVL